MAIVIALLLGLFAGQVGPFPLSLPHSLQPRKESQATLPFQSLPSSLGWISPWSPFIGSASLAVAFLWVGGIKQASTE